MKVEEMKRGKKRAFGEGEETREGDGGKRG